MTFLNVSVIKDAEYSIENETIMNITGSLLGNSNKGTITNNNGSIIYLPTDQSRIDNVGILNYNTIVFYWENVTFNGSEIRNNGLIGNITNIIINGSSTWYENGTIQNLSSMIIGASSEWVAMNLNLSNALELDTITIKNTGTMSHQENTDAIENILKVKVQNMTVESGGTIDVAAKGYAGGTFTTVDGSGPGGGTGHSVTTGGDGGGGGWRSKQ